MAYVDVPFGGLMAQNAPERIPADQAIEARDCNLDDNTLTPRNGYRSLLSTSIVAVSYGAATTINLNNMGVWV